MALVIVTDPFDPLCNSYVSAAYMLEYVQTRVPDPAVLSAWEALTADQKSMYLVNATRSIDMMAEWIGDKYSRDQRLDWPRTNAIVDGFLVDQITFPEPIKEATCEMAVWSLQNSGAVSVQQNAAFDSIRVGPINIDFNEQVAGTSDKYFPDIVAYILKDYGTLSNPNAPSAKSVKFGRLQRA